MSSHQPLKMMKEAHALAHKSCIPWYTSIELGLQCNLTCTHCYNFDRQKPMPEEMKKTLPYERLLTLIDELKEAGTLMVSFTGGEALMHPHLFDLIKRARENNLLVKIKSNGTLVTKELALKFKNYEVYDFDISVYGGTTFEHDWLTNKAGSYEKTIQGIKNLREANIPVMMNFILHQKNYLSIDKMIETATSLDCHYSMSTEMTKRYDQSSPQDIVGLTREQFQYLLKSEHRDSFMASNENEDLQCECARTVCAVNSKGDVFPCIGAPVYSGNIQNESFLNIWKTSSELEKIRNLKKDDFKDCIKCDLIKNCSRSSGSALVNTGNYTGANPPNCLEAEERKNYLSF
jgi:radical SAM protein with 4Fe4S-binding SPASM domain